MEWERRNYHVVRNITSGAMSGQTVSGLRANESAASQQNLSEIRHRRNLTMRHSNRRPLTFRSTSMAVLLLSVVTITVGCERASVPEFVSGKGLSELDPELQTAVRDALLKACGTPGNLKMLGGNSADAQLLKRGAEVYQRNCQQCHGASGDGAGPAAEYLTPKPRDYRRGIFKFASTPYGSKPRREDLMRTIERGVVGTSMPSFRLMPKHDLDAVLEYVLALTHRGELEEQLVLGAEDQGAIDEQMVTELSQTILDRWKSEAETVVEPLTKMPPITPESIAAGAAVFRTRECFKCHGKEGRGGLATGIDVGNDTWGHKDPAADLTAGMLHGGAAPLDIYRRITSGINGTPMPGYKDSFAKDPDTLWNLTHYVLWVTNQRRQGVQFPYEASLPTAAPQAVETPAPTTSGEGTP